MKIGNLTYKEYKLEFKTPHISSGNKLAFKNALVITAQTDNGKTVFSEASPLPGFSEESIKDVIEEIESFKAQIINSDHTELPNIISNTKSSSLKFALEQIHSSLNALNTEPVNLKIKCNSLTNSISISALQLGKYKNTIIKVKTGLTDFDFELNAIDNIQNELIDNNIRLRIDPNGAWSEAQVSEFYDTITPSIIDYFEQPLNSIDALLRLVKQGLPIATDELNYEDDLLEVILESDINVLVIKPTVFGGLENIKKKIPEKTKNKRIVISSALESNIGWNYLAFIASKFPDETHGISTVDLYHNEIVKLGYSQTAGYINIHYPQNF